MMYDLKKFLIRDISGLWRTPFNWVWYFLVENESPADRRSWIELEIQELKEKCRDQDRTIKVLEEELHRVRDNRNRNARHLSDLQRELAPLAYLRELFTADHQELIPGLSHRQKQTLARMIKLTIENCTNYFATGAEPPSPASWNQWRELTLEEHYFREHNQ